MIDNMYSVYLDGMRTEFSADPKWYTADDSQMRLYELYQSIKSDYNLGDNFGWPTVNHESRRIIYTVRNN